MVIIVREAELGFLSTCGTLYRDDMEYFSILKHGIKRQLGLRTPYRHVLYIMSRSSNASRSNVGRPY